MTDAKRSLLAAVLSLLVLVGWYYFFGKNQFPSPPAGPPSSVGSSGGSAGPQPLSLRSENNLVSSSHSIEAVPEKVTSQETALVSMDWTNRGGGLRKFLIKNYDVNLLPFDGERGPLLLCANCSALLPEDQKYSQVSGAGETVLYEAEANGLLVQKKYEWAKDSYLLNLKVMVENRSDREFRGRLGLGWRGRQFPEAPRKAFGFLKTPSNQRTFLYNLADTVVRDGKKDLLKDVEGPVTWAGIEDRYFLISFISRRLSSDLNLHLQSDNDGLAMALYPSEVILPPHGRHEESFSLYLGPKERTSLQVAGVNLEKAIDYGWFSFLAVPILKLLQFFHAVVRNWGVAILVLTLLIKLLMNPLTIKSMKQMKEMQRLQPKLTELKEKYKDDRQRLNMETMQLFKSHKVNPMGGCLPMLLQMPIYIALYKVLYNAIELYRAPFFWFYKDLSAPDPYFILPVLLGVSMVAQQKLTPSTSADPAQKQMMMIMPIMFTAFMLFLPVGLVLYIFVNTVSSVLQQWMYKQEIGWRDLLRGRLRGAASNSLPQTRRS